MESTGRQEEPSEGDEDLAREAVVADQPSRSKMREKVVDVHLDPSIEPRTW
jgi:hypothetical protein